MLFECGRNVFRLICNGFRKSLECQYTNIDVVHTQRGGGRVLGVELFNAFIIFFPFLRNEGRVLCLE